MTLKDGGPAFPTVMSVEIDRGGVVSTQAVDGMSLRDYFAGQTLTLVNKDIFLAINATANEANATPAGHVAKFVYAIADAMLKERAK